MTECPAVRELALLPVIDPSEGAGLLLSLARRDGSRVSVLLDPASAVAVAGDLVQAARLRMGREDWPGCAVAALATEDGAP